MKIFKKIIDFIKNIMGNSNHNDSSKKQTFNIKGNKAPVYILDNSIDKISNNKSNDNKSICPLSKKAKEILSNAVKSDGFIYTDNNDDGKLFCGNLKVDLFNISIKEKTEWIGAIEELEKKDYIIGNEYNHGFYDAFSSDNSFEVTKKGFDYFDDNKEQSISSLTYEVVDE